MNKLSIILVSYNRPEYLTESINSMINQTYRCWELLVMDYSNTRYEEIKKVLDDFQKKDERIKVFYHRKYDPKNISICWNEALDLMTGDYWGLLDDDDTKMPNFAEITVNELDTNPNIEAVAYGTKNIGSRTDNIPIQTNFTIEDLRYANRIGSGSIVYRKSVLDKIGYFDPNMVYAEDWEYILRFCIMIGKEKIKFLPHCLIGYRWHNDKRQYINNYPALLSECVSYMLNKKMIKQTEKKRMTYKPEIKTVVNKQPENIQPENAAWGNPHIKNPQVRPNL